MLFFNQQKMLHIFIKQNTDSIKWWIKSVKRNASYVD